MKHIKLFEQQDYKDQTKIIGSNNKLYLVAIVDDNGESSNYAFYDEKSRDNFLINTIHGDFTDADDDSIKDIFDIEELIILFNEGDDKIFLNEAEILTNVKLTPELQMRKDAIKYNL